jgi:hypothetical protein
MSLKEWKNNELNQTSYEEIWYSQRRKTRR